MSIRISIGEALSIPAKAGILIDVRTPLEFEEGAIPGAINVPILSNEERVEIGTLYKKEGGCAARERGLYLISPKLPQLFTEIKRVSDKKIPILYCWRGGLRSETMAAVCDLSGLSVKVIEGGYKSYRQQTLSLLNGEYPFELITLYGLTGSGKTILLRRMKEQGMPVIDLEALARHRGSVFGHVGFSEKQTQKNFEALLYNEIQKYGHERIVFIEGESQRIGSVLLPAAWMRQMAAGRKIFIQSSLQKRTRRILEEYLPHVEELEEALISLKKRLGGELFAEIHELFKQKKYDDVVQLLLERYYDRNYKFCGGETFPGERISYAAAREGNMSPHPLNKFVKVLSFETEDDQQKIAATLLDTLVEKRVV